MTDAEDKYAHLFPEDELKKEREKQNKTRRLTIPTINIPWGLFDLKKFYASETTDSKTLIDFGISPATDQKYKCVSRINMNRLTEVVGEYYHEDSIATAHSRVSGNKGWATLRPDTNNEHDDYAVSVHIEGRKVGFIPTDLARRMQRRLILLQEHRQERVCCPAVFYESNDRSVMQIGLYADIVSIIHDGIQVPRPSQKPISLPSAGFIITLFVIFGFLYLIGSCASLIDRSSSTTDLNSTKENTPTAGPQKATVYLTTMDEARPIYQHAIDIGLILLYDKPSETIVVNESMWETLPLKYKTDMAGAALTLIGYGTADVGFKLVGNTTSQTLSQHTPSAYKTNPTDQNAPLTPSASIEEAIAMVDLAVESGLIVRWDNLSKILYVNQSHWEQQDVQTKKALLFSFAAKLTGKWDGYISYEVHGSHSDKLLASYSPWSGTDLNP